MKTVKKQLKEAEAEINKQGNKIDLAFAHSVLGDKTLPGEIIDLTEQITPDKLQTLEEERGKIYGDPLLCHQAIGLAWEGVFRNRYQELPLILPDDKGNNPIELGKLFPADLVAEFLAAFKIIRLARPTFYQDSADDAKVYISFSERFRKNGAE